jgi:hypothetical protein
MRERAFVVPKRLKLREYDCKNQIPWKRRQHWFHFLFNGFDGKCGSAN